MFLIPNEFYILLITYSHVFKGPSIKCKNESCTCWQSMCWQSTLEFSKPTAFPFKSRATMRLIPHPVVKFSWQSSVNLEDHTITAFERSMLPNFNYDSALATKCLSSYAKFLQKSSVTFGLIKTQQNNDSSLITLALFGIVLLAFGKIITSSSQLDSTVVILPVIGGLLSQSEANGDNGKLQFSLSPTGELVTSIHDYKSSLISSAPRKPFSKMRIFIYMYTQRLAHAFVMWRFHSFVRDELKS